MLQTTPTYCDRGLSILRLLFSVADFHREARLAKPTRVWMRCEVPRTSWRREALACPDCPSNPHSRSCLAIDLVFSAVATVLARSGTRVDDASPAACLMSAELCDSRRPNPSFSVNATPPDAGCLMLLLLLRPGRAQAAMMSRRPNGRGDVVVGKETGDPRAAFVAPHVVARASRSDPSLQSYIVGTAPTPRCPSGLARRSPWTHPHLAHISAFPGPRLLLSRA